VLDRLTSLFRRNRPAPPAPVPSADVLQVAYAPSADGDADPGEVVWTWVPYEDNPRQGKDRPVLVIGSFGKDLAVVPLTSKNHMDRGEEIELGTGDWDSEHRVSYVKLDRVLRVPAAKVRREGSALDRPRFDAVIDALRAFHAR
jgi:hypothetical protein